MVWDGVVADGLGWRFRGVGGLGRVLGLWLLMLDGGGGPGWMLESAGTGTRGGFGGCHWFAVVSGCEVKGAVLRGTERNCWVVVSGEVEVEGEREGEFESAQRRSS